MKKINQTTENDNLQKRRRHWNCSDSTAWVVEEEGKRLAFGGCLKDENADSFWRWINAYHWPLREIAERIIGKARTNQANNHSFRFDRRDEQSAWEGTIKIEDGTEETLGKLGEISIYNLNPPTAFCDQMLHHNQYAVPKIKDHLEKIEVVYAALKKELNDLYRYQFYLEDKEDA